MFAHRPGPARPRIVPVTDLVTIDDPRIGLPDPALAELVWRTLSRVTGAGTGWRPYGYWLCRALAGIANINFRFPDGTIAEPPDISVPPIGWPQAKTVLRRIDVTPEELSDAWADALALDDLYATLPLTVMTQLFPPAIWPMAAQAIAWGPAHLTARMERWLRQAARGKAPGCNKPMLAQSLEAPISAVWKFMAVLEDLRARNYPSPLVETEAGDVMPILEPWGDKIPKRVKVDASFNASRERRDRTAPPYPAVRRAISDLTAKIEKGERTRIGRLYLQRPLRSRALLALAVVLAGRSEPLEYLNVNSYEPNHLCFDGVRRQAVLIERLKGNRWIRRWKVIPTDVAKFIEELIKYCEIGDQPEQQLWFADWEYFDENTGERRPGSSAKQLGRGVVRRPRPTRVNASQLSGTIAKLLQPHLDGLPRKSAHTLRHLGSQLAKESAQEYRRANPDTPAHITDNVIAKSLLDHEMTSISARYDDVDTEASRQHWARIASEGIWEIIGGAGGARKGLDEAAIISARDRLQEAQAELKATEERLAALKAKRQMLTDGRSSAQRRIRKLKRERRTLHGALAAGTLDLQLIAEERNRLADELEDARDELENHERRLRDSLEDVHELRLAASEAVHAREKDLAQAIEQRIPLPDDAPDYDEDVLLAELVGQSHVPHGGTEQPADKPLRDTLSIEEFASALGVPYSSVTRWIRNAQKSPLGLAFTPGNRRNPWHQPISEILEELGPHTRRFVFSRLDKSHYHPDQIARMKAFLSRPA